MKKSYVQLIIDYIEDHIEEVITIDHIANYIGYSKFYLNRMFRIFTGTSIMNYAKKRKLEYCLFELNKDMAIVDIAVKYGFSSRRVLSRLITNYYGHSPSYFRNNHFELRPKMVLEDIGGIRMLEYLSKASVVYIDELYVLARRVISNNPEEQVIELQQKYKNDNNLQVIREFGFDIPVSDEDQSKGKRGYEYWLCVDKETYESIPDVDIPKKLRIPGSKYITLSIQEPFQNPFERIPNGWKKLSSYLDEDTKLNENVGIWGLEEVINQNGISTMYLFIPIN